MKEDININNKCVILYTDGACNSKKTSFAWLLLEKGRENLVLRRESGLIKKDEDKFDATYAELEAIRRGLIFALSRNPKRVCIKTDCQAAIYIITKTDNQIINPRYNKAADQIASLISDSDVEIYFEWVKAHDKDEYNMEVDRYASRAISTSHKKPKSLVLPRPAGTITKVKYKRCVIKSSIKKKGYSEPIYGNVRLPNLPKDYKIAWDKADHPDNENT